MIYMRRLEANVEQLYKFRNTDNVANAVSF